MLPLDPAALEPLFRELDDWRRRLDLLGPHPIAWEGRLRRDLEAEAIAASTSMEGVDVTVDEVRRILAGDTPPRVTDEDRGLVEGYREAMRFVLRQAEATTFRWDRGLIIGLHDRILAGRYSLGAGRLRTASVWLADRGSGDVVFRPPPHEQVSDLVDEICREMEVRSSRSGIASHPAATAAWVHIALAAVHPFRDGNGRSARVLASLAMYRGGFKRSEFTSLEEWWGRHLPSYYSSFRCLGDEFDSNADVTPFVETHVRAQLSQVRGLYLRQQVERRIWTVVETVVRYAHLDERMANAVYDAFFEHELTAGYYRELADVSRATATNDLSAAVAAELLEPRGATRGRRYVPGPRLYARAAEVLDIPEISPADASRELIVGWLSERLAGEYRAGAGGEAP